MKCSFAPKISWYSHIKTVFNQLLFAMILPSLAFSNANLAYSTNSVTRVHAPKQVPVTGKVVDENGVTVPGVSVLEKGTSNGVITDANGNYRINVSSNAATLVFTSVGFVKVEAKIRNGQANVTLTASSTELGTVTVVAVGYGTLDRREVTSAVTHVPSG